MEDTDNPKRRIPQSAPHPSTVHYRDTSVNIATAINQAHSMTPPFQRISPISQRINAYWRSPVWTTQLPSRRDSEQDDESIILAHNEKDQEREMNEFFGNSDDDGADIYEEETYLADHPEKEERLRDLVDRGIYSEETTETDESDMEHENVEEYHEGEQQEKEQEEQEDSPSLASENESSEKEHHGEGWLETRRVYDTIFEFIMFSIFMVFWTIKESVFLAVSTLIVNPILVVLCSFGFQPSCTSSGHAIPRRQAWVLVAMTIALLIVVGKTIDNTTIATRIRIYPRQALDTISGWTHKLISAPYDKPSFPKPIWAPIHSQSDTEDVIRRLTAAEGAISELLAQRFERLKGSDEGLSDKHKEHVSSLTAELDHFRQGQKRMEQLLKDGVPGKQWMEAVQSRLDELEAFVRRTQEKERSMEERLTSMDDRVMEKSELEKSVRDAVEQKLSQESWTHVQADGEVTLRPEVDQWLKSHFATHDFMDQWAKEEFQQWMKKQLASGTIVTRETLKQLLNEELGQFRSDGHEPIAEVVESIIQKYQQDTLNQPDFALASRGARIIPSLTSPTYTVYPRHYWMRGISKLTGFGRRTAASPWTALTPNMQAGECWAMDGTSGTLAIELSQPLAIQQITIEHLTRQMAINLSSAPKDIEVWGLKRVPGGLFRRTNRPWETKDPNAVFLGSFRYDIKRSTPIQTFDLDTKDYVIFRAVLIRVVSNWGNDAYTCLYRVRVHGIPEE
ncbi:hypothetical protein EC973_005245 [Apophysomyces ossiformis]|uniref:SUN domain-containing protein n=1 Tax=Apophysomyces ossiformis TaxID=679940 RepID=A0A8H7ETP0_9FUNG|nr:hypothetical protein EC973_005245 [Apophysomyces ossiformis]